MQDPYASLFSFRVMALFLFAALLLCSRPLAAAWSTALTATLYAASASLRLPPATAASNFFRLVLSYDIVIGLPYAAKLKSMPVEAENGYANTLGKRKRIQGISVYFQNTNHAKIGTDFTRMNEVKWRRNEKPGQAVDLQTDYVFMHLTQHYENQNHVCIMSEAPLPLTVLALLPEVQVGG